MQKILRRREVESLTGLARSSIYELVAAGKFPKPIKLTGRSVGWVESEVTDWLSGRIKLRDSEQSRRAA
jgi:prophage regulatory protein